MNKLIFPVIFVLFSTVIFGDTGISITHPNPGTARSNFVRAFTCYIADGISDHHDSACMNSTQITLDTSRLPQSATEEMREAIDPSTAEINLLSIQAWWNTWAYGLLTNRRQSAMIKDRLEGFKQAVPFETWDKEIIEFSAIKRKTRVIYRSPVGFAFGMSVAVTLDTESAILTAPVRETEIAIDRDDGSGNADFYVYDKDGHLSTVSNFPAGERPAPSFCLGCHHSIIKHTFGRQDI